MLYILFKSDLVFIGECSCCYNRNILVKQLSLFSFLSLSLSLSLFSLSLSLSLHSLSLPSLFSLSLLCLLNTHTYIHTNSTCVGYMYRFTFFEVCLIDQRRNSRTHKELKSLNEALVGCSRPS